MSWEAAVEERATLFVSYSRRDAAFVTDLQAHLEERHLEVWIDYEDIAPSVNWRDEIQDGIERAEAFIIVLSPSSATSTEVDNEIARAVNLGKRIIPILHQDVDPTEIHPAVTERNWIYWRNDQDRQDALDKIDRSLRVDPKWTKEHTRLSGLALEWEKKQRGKNLVLRGSDLKAAEASIVVDRPTEQPQVTALMREYVNESRAAATRRQRTMVAIASIVAVVSVSLAVIAALQRADAVRQRDIATSTALASQAENTLRVEPDLAALLALESFRTRDTVDARGALIQVLGTPTHFASRDVTHSAPVISVAHHAASNVAATGDADGVVVLWDTDPDSADAAARSDRIETSGDVNSLAFGQDGRTLVIASSFDGAQVWDIAVSPPVQTSTVATGAFDLVAFGDGAYVVGIEEVDSEAAIVIYDVSADEGVAIEALGITMSEYFAGSRVNAAVSMDMSKIALGWDDVLFIWSPDESEEVEQIYLDEFLEIDPTLWALVSAVEFVGETNHLVVAIEEGDIFRIDLDTGAIVRAFPVSTNSPTAFAATTMDIDGVATDVLASSHQTGEVKVWASRDGSLVELATLLGHGEEALSVGFTENGSLATGGWDGDVIWWRVVEEPQLGRSLIVPDSATSHDIDIHSVSFLPDNRAVSADVYGDVLWWDLDSGVLMDGPVEERVMSLDEASGTIAFGGFDGSLLVVDATGGAPIDLHDAEHDGGVRLVEVSEDGTMLVSVDEAHQISIWNVAERRRVASVAIPSGFEVESAVFPSAGQLWIAGWEGADGDAGVSIGYDVDPSSGTIRDSFRHNDDENGRIVRSMALSPDGSTLVTGGTDRRIFVFDATDLSKATAEWAGHQGIVTDLVFLNNEVVIGADQDRSVLMWDVASGRAVGEFVGPTDGVNDLDLSSSGVQLMAGGEDDTVRLWDMRIDVWLDRLCDFAGRNMSEQEWARYRLKGDAVNHCERFAAADRPLANYPIEPK